MKIFYLVILILMMGCHSLQINQHEIDGFCVDCTFEKVVNDENGEPVYQLPSRLISLPISIFTWYPNQASTLSAPIINAGEVGQFVWRGDCLLFKTKNNEFITPIFWVNTIKAYHDNNGKSILIRHDGVIIALNKSYDIDINPEPKQNNRTDWIVQHGQDKCLMDKVVYLSSSVVSGV